MHSSFLPNSKSNEAQFVNPFEAEVQKDDEDSEDQEVLDDTRENSTALTSSHHIVSRLPVDLSQKSALNREEQSKTGFADANKRTTRPTAISRAGSGTARASLDVDAFKRLIMTGEKGITASGTTPAQNLKPQSILVDSSSSTDTSSISRHSLFETMTEFATDTPRTSHEISVSDDELQQRAGASSLATRNPEPPAGNLRHEASLNSSMPRTVSSFNSSRPFSVSESRIYTNDVQVSNTNLLSQTSKDLNKPLPLPPNYKQSEQSTGIEQGYRTTPDDSSNNVRSNSRSSMLLKKRPPTPPLARRHSHLRSSNPLLSRSNSARLPPSSAHDVGSPGQVTNVRTPRPPPTRRTLPGRAQSFFETSMHTRTVLPGSPSAIAGSITEKQQTSRPPVPPTRTHSISSIKRPYRPPPTASSVTKVPPLPPPRNRGSSQSSFDNPRIDMLPKRSATDSSSSLRQTSKESPQGNSVAPVEGSLPMPATVPGTNANDILADLSVLQREVDELRGMYEIRRASE